MLHALRTVALALALGGTALPAAAQTVIPGGAQAEAQARLVCGSGTVLSATYLPGGLLRVTCRSNAQQQSSSGSTSDLPAPLEGTALVPTISATVLTILVVAAIVTGEEETPATTSTAVDR